MNATEEKVPFKLVLLLTGFNMQAIIFADDM